MFGMHGDQQGLENLKENIRRWGRELGFDAIGFSGVDVPDAEAGLAAWLATGCHGEMDYMAA
jgi:epoxyqueuosine reductase